jgi:hypothetical protein
LAIRLADIAEQSEKLEHLAAILGEGSTDFLITQQVRIIAEGHLELRRIRAVQRGLFHEIFSAVDDPGSKVSEIAKIGRYARRSASRRKTALNKLFPKWNEVLFQLSRKISDIRMRARRIGRTNPKFEL